MKIAIVGATGEVGRMMLRTLEEETVPATEVRLFASARQQGRQLSFRGVLLPVEPLTEAAMRQRHDYVLFSAGGSVAGQFAPIAAEAGATVIDNSSAFRREPDIPLVVPEINGQLLQGYRGIVANPNCSTIQLVLALYPLLRFDLRQVVVSTYQSVSGAGHKGLDAWERERRGEAPNGVFPRPIDGNVIPQVGDFLPEGWCVEEDKMRHEMRKILHLPELDVCATTVRVPVRHGHSESVWARFGQEIKRVELDDVMSQAPSVVYHGSGYLTAIELGDSTLSHVGRVRLLNDGHALAFWNVGHNVRLGAATNAVRILIMAERLKKALS